MDFEYCIMHSDFPNEPHRGPWAKDTCVLWLQDWIEDGGAGGVFYLACRPVAKWERCS